MDVGMQDRLPCILPDVYPDIESSYLVVNVFYLSFLVI